MILSISRYFLKVGSDRKVFSDKRANFPRLCLPQRARAFSFAVPGFLKVIVMKMMSQNRTLRPAVVKAVHDVTPHMRRVTLVGDDIKRLPVEHPAQWMKVFLPAPPGRKPEGRAYTIRRYEATAGLMEMDFVLHGDNGPASAWAEKAKVGDVLQLAGPRAGYRVDPAASRHLMVGDATSLPAIAAILEALPPGVTADAFIEVNGTDEEQKLETAASLNVTWLHSGSEPPGTTGQLELAVQGAVLDLSNCQAWVAGESFMVRAVRTYLTVDRLLPSGRLHAAGYWKMGDADHRDRD